MQIDKLYHFIAGMFIFWVASFFINYAIVPVIIIALLKEIYDLRFKRSYMCIYDIIATIVGGAVMGVILNVL